MRHPEVFLVPLLMLLDYFLTVGGAKLAARKYSQHFKFESYELNPLWQKAIAKGKWFCPRHLLLVIFVSFVCFVWADIWRERTDFFEGALGALLILYSTVLAAHVANLLTFWRMVRKPEEVTGEIRMSQKYVFATSRHRFLMALFPVAFAAWFAPSPFLYGGVASLVMFSVVLLIWSFNYREKTGQEPA